MQARPPLPRLSRFSPAMPELLLEGEVSLRTRCSPHSHLSRAWGRANNAFAVALCCPRAFGPRSVSVDVGGVPHALLTTVVFSRQGPQAWQPRSMVSPLRSPSRALQRPDRGGASSKVLPGPVRPQCRGVTSAGSAHLPRRSFSPARLPVSAAHRDHARSLCGRSGCARHFVSEQLCLLFRCGLSLGPATTLWRSFPCAYPLLDLRWLCPPKLWGCVIRTDADGGSWARAPCFRCSLPGLQATPHLEDIINVLAI
ncbi:hypothetical protein NDU88_007134 [Pleurodeles waltl]|uniref:Uncharacterized protein n=1 Tax=Pleurodeles waltl TaxID=8319 RepID=A0AAV7NSC4_PLEWA|nr:hypothetical protein NDU88_007134 [Pleurodeles waltl]